LASSRCSRGSNAGKSAGTRRTNVENRQQTEGRATTVTTVDAGPHQVSRSVDVPAPAAELFALVADPRRHCEVDGSGTVRDNIRGPAPLQLGSRFCTKMRMFGLPYRITSKVTALQPDQLIEWRHPVGHRWRWEFAVISPTSTRVTETFDYSDAGPVKNRLKYYEATGFAKRNAAGIEASLRQLRDRFSR
jgi:hypothetical protein